MNPTVSLLVPVYNREDLLVPCLESALAQTYQDLEVVVVDGASADGSWDVCSEFARRDPRVRAFRDLVNPGPVKGWWRCVEEARGQFATFLWSDDLLMPTFLEKTVPFLEDPGVAFAFTAAEIGDRPGNGTVHFAHPAGLLSADAYIDEAVSLSGSTPASPACALFRLADLKASFCQELPTDPPVDLSWTGAGTDLLLYLLTARRYPYVASISEPLSFFRFHAGSITVDGRGGQVARHYALATSWFARTSLHDRRRANLILTRDWIHQMRSGGRYLSAGRMVTEYHGLVSRPGLVATAAELMLRKLLRTGLSRIQRAITRLHG